LLVYTDGEHLHPKVVLRRGWVRRAEEEEAGHLVGIVAMVMADASDAKFSDGVREGGVTVSCGSV
jgi:hypothetical protein